MTGESYLASERDGVFYECIARYGIDAQMDMAIEEMSELTKALLKWRRTAAALMFPLNEVNPVEGKTVEEAEADIIDELADVKIMCRQIELMFDCEAETEKRIDYKVERQIKRLGGKADDNG